MKAARLQLSHCRICEAIFAGRPLQHYDPRPLRAIAQIVSDRPRTEEFAHHS